MSRTVVLLSSGLDSTVNLYKAHSESDVVLALTVDYGQRAAAREIERAQAFCNELGIPHKTIELPFLAEITQTALVNRDNDIPENVELDEFTAIDESAKSVWVPNRNGVFLNIAASFAESLDADTIIVGFNKEEAVTFPDNSQQYLEATTKAFHYSTSNHVQVACYTTNMNKVEIAKLGRELKANFDLMWPCYHGEETPCGKCESCQRFLRATQ